MSEILLRLLLAASVFALVATIAWWHRSRKRSDWAPAVGRMAAEDLPQPGDPLVAVLFSSRFCSPCQQIPGVVLAAAPEIPLIELPLHQHPHLAKRYGLVSTPTLLLVDEQRRIRYAHVGVPDEQELWLYVREAWDSTRSVRALVAHRRKAS